MSLNKTVSAPLSEEEGVYFEEILFYFIFK